jgi:hypothetical protein
MGTASGSLATTLTDNVQHTGMLYHRLDVEALGNAIVALGNGGSVPTPPTPPASVPGDLLGKTLRVAGLQTVTVNAGQVVNGIDFGDFKVGTISGAVYLDANGNGHLDNGESGLSGWTVTLHANGGNAPDQRFTTDPSGTFTFGSLAAGSYTLSETLQSNYHRTEPGSANAFTYTFTVTSQFAAADNFGDQLNPPAVVAVQASDSFYTGHAVQATATVAGTVPGVDDTPAASLEGVTPTLTYYLGSDTSGTALVDLPVAAGTYTVVGFFPGSRDYLTASATTTFKIKPAPLTVQPDNQSKGYGQIFTDFTGSFTGLQNGDNLSATYSSAGSAATADVVSGGYTITVASVTGAALANYTVTPLTGTLTVTPALLTVTPADQTKIYGQTFTAFTGTVTGLVNGDPITVSYASLGAAATAGVAGSPYPITASLDGPANKLADYGATLNTSHLTVTAQGLTVLVISSGSPSGLGQGVTFTATVSGVLANSPTPTGTVQFEVDGVNVGSPVPLTAGGTAGYTTTMLAVGRHTITALYLGDGNFQPNNGSVSQTVSPVALIAAADFDGDATGVRGQLRNFVLSVSAGAAGVPAGVTYTVDWGDGHVETFAGDATQGGTAAVSHVYTDVGNYTMSVTATVNGQVSQPATHTTAVKVVDYQLVRIDATDASKTTMALVVGSGAHNSVIEIENDVGPHLLDVEIENVSTGQYELHLAFDDSSGGVAVGRLLLFGQASDVLMVAPSVTIDAELHASDHGSILKAGGGNDILIGGTGDDILIGGRGRDILIGGMGSDVLVAGQGDDILIAGKTSYDHNALALRAVLNEWTSGDSYATRVNDILGRTAAGFDLNATYFLNSSTVQDDHAVDFLDGGAGRDWFIADTTGQTGPCDVVLDAHAKELVTNI